MWGIIQLGISFRAIFPLFSYESSQGHVHSSRGKSRPRPPPLNDSPDTDLRGLMVVLEIKLTTKQTYFSDQYSFKNALILFITAGNVNIKPFSFSK